MVTKMQKMLNSLQTADPFETWHKNRSSLKVVLFVFKIFKMATNIKIKKIVKKSKMKRFQWKWIFTGSKTCCTTLQPFWFAMDSKWLPKYKDPPIWTKFGFQVDYDVATWYPSLVCYGGHFESQISAKIQKSSDLDEMWFPSRLWCCELISIVDFLWRPFWIQNGCQNTKILRCGRNLVSK